MSKLYTFGVPRSGSTLIWRMVTLMMENSNTEVIKTHDCPPTIASGVILTKRHPYDGVVSMYNCDTDGDFTDVGNFSHQVYRMSQFYEEYLKTVRNVNPNKLLSLKYEDFYRDNEYAFDIISKFLKLDCDDRKTAILDEVSLDRATKIANQYDKFHQYDKITHIHGKHIGGVKHDQWKDLPDALINLLHTRLGKYVPLLGY